MKITAIITLVLLLSRSPLAADLVVSPNVVNGNSGAEGPFLIGRDMVSSFRQQEVHSATDFSAISTLPLLITEISFAPRREGQPAIDVTAPNMDVRFSITTRNPDSLSPMFAENTGTAETVVLSGAVHVFDNGTERFGIHIQLQQPFLYDPSLGNLLLDFRNFATIAPPSTGAYVLEGELRGGDSVSSVVSGDLGVNSPNGFFTTAGYVTRFTYTPVPEPSTWVLLCVGLFAIALLKYHRAPNRK